MKRINLKNFLVTGIKTIMIIIPICMLIIVSSCENMNSLHKEYLDRGETLYIGVADSIKVLFGVTPPAQVERTLTFKGKFDQAFALDNFAHTFLAHGFQGVFCIFPRFDYALQSGA